MPTPLRTVPLAPDPPLPPPPPRSVTSFVGRDRELARVRELVAREPLFVLYGVAGIGKSELLYRLGEAVAAMAPWDQLPPVHVKVPPRATVDELVAVIAHGVGVAASTRVIAATGGAAPGAASAADDLVRALEARPRVLLLDDVHELGATAAGELVAHLARHVRQSRVFAASRAWLALPPGAATPVALRLSPLDERDTGRLVELLAHRLGVASPDAADVFRRTGGSPFFVQREVSGDDGPDPLARTLGELSAAARALLLLASVMGGRLAPAEVAAAPLEELARRLLVNVERGACAVHDLVGAALLRTASPDELCGAHRAAAEHLLARAGERGTGAPLEAALAIEALAATGDAERAWQIFGRVHGAIAAAGLDSLLVAPLGAIRDAAPPLRFDVDLAIARIQLGRSQVEEARQRLRRAAREPGARTSARHALLTGAAEARLGRLPPAEAAFRRAAQLATTPAERLQATLELANMASLRGDGDAARALLASVRNDAEPSARELGRWGWSLALSYVYESRYGEAVAAARHAAREIAGRGADDLVVDLALHELLGRVETHDVAGARALLDRIRSDAGAHGPGGRRAEVIEVYAGTLQWAEGDALGARAVLEVQHDYLDAHADTVHALMAGHYLGWARLALGEAAGAAELFRALAARAAATGLESTVPHLIAAEAAALLAAGRLPAARRRAATALGARRPPVRTRFLARVVLAHAAALDGRLAEARRELERALAAIPAGRAEECVVAADLHRATIELFGGDLDLAITLARRAQRRFAAAGRRWYEAQAALTLAAARVLRGGAADVVRAEPPLARARALAQAHGYRPIALRAELVDAAIAAKAGDAGALRVALAGIFRDAPDDTLEAIALHGALDPGAHPPAGLAAALDAFGVDAGPRYELVDRRGRRPGTERELAHERERHELVVDLARGAILTRDGRALHGRPVACALLARLIDAQPAPVSAETLFLDVWHGREYHPLRHRNTVYVGMSRLRRSLAELLPGREVIETAPGGWRLCDDLDAAAARLTERRA